MRFFISIYDNTTFFLSTEDNIKAVEHAIEFNKPIMIVVSKPSKELTRQRVVFITLELLVML